LLIAELVYDCSGKQAVSVFVVTELIRSAHDAGLARHNVKWDNKQRKTWKSYQWKIGLTAAVRTDANSAATWDALRGDGRRARLMQIRRRAALIGQ